MRTRHPAALILAVPLILLAFACSSDSESPDPTSTATTVGESTPVATAATVASGSPTPAPTPARTVSSAAEPFSESQRATALEILEKAGNLRGAPSNEPVDTYLIDRQGALDDYTNSFTDEDKRLLGVQSRLYGLVGLIPDGTDYIETFLSLIETGILGYYDPDLKAFFLLDDLGGLSSQTSLSTIVHEFAHALQDEYYDINKMYDARKTDWDASTALAHVIEGNAVATESAYFGRAVRPKPACFQLPGFSRSNPPYTIVRELNSWYDDGLCFLEAVAPNLADQEAVLQNLPVSTEQIFHPEKYRAGEQPVAVSLPSLLSALGSGWSQSETSTLGEFTLQNLLIQGLSTDRARVLTAAGGWGGDKWAFYESGDDRVFHTVIAWDTESDASEFLSALTQSLSGRGGKETAASERSSEWQVEGKTWRIDRSGLNVTLLVADSADDLNRAAAAANAP